MKIETFLEKRKALDDMLREHAKEMLHTLFADFFAAAPEVKTITWTQYTPYFNDGDACTFGVNEVHFAKKFPEDIEDFGPYGADDGDADNWIDVPWKKEERTAAFADFLSNFGAAEMVLEALGDHSHIIVTNREDGLKIEVEDYSHD